MTTFNKTRMWVMVCAMVLANLPAFSQTIQFTLYDNVNQEPIEGATYTYNGVQQSTPASGMVSLPSADATLQLSHISYGQRNLTPKEILTADSLGYLLWQPIAHMLSPTQVLAVRKREDNNLPSTDLALTPAEHLEHDGAAVLQQDPSFGFVRKSGNYGFDPVFRGFGTDRLNVILDDAQTASAACPNRMDPATSQMAPNMIERVEVFKGPHALRYGTGLGGTIRFVSPKPMFYDSLKVTGRLSTGFESNGLIFRNEGVLGLAKKRVNAQIFASWAQGKDYTDGNGNEVPSSFKRGSFGGRFAFRLNDYNTLTATVQRNLARDADFPALMMDLRKDDTWMANLKHTVRVKGDGPLQSWTTTAYASWVDHLMDNGLRNNMMMAAQTDAITRTWGGRTEGTWKWNEMGLFAGADLRSEYAEGIRERMPLMGPMAGRTFTDNAWQAGRITRIAGFASFHKNIDHWHFMASGRLAINRSDVQDPAPEFEQRYQSIRQTQVNPSLSLGVRKTLKQKHSISLWLARVQRSGSLTERFINYFPVGLDPFEMLGNPNLAPETNYQADLAYQWNTPNTSLQVNGFASFLTDYITGVIDPNLSTRMPNSPGVRQFVNVSSAFKMGGEFQWKQRLIGGLHHDLRFAYTYGVDRERNEPLPEIAPFDLRYSLYGLYIKDRLRPEISLRYVSWQTRISSAFGENETPTFTTLNASLSYRFPKWISVSGGVNNLLDLAYYEHLSRNVVASIQPIYAPGRNFFVSLNLRLQ